MVYMGIIVYVYMRPKFVPILLASPKIIQDNTFRVHGDKAR